MMAGVSRRERYLPDLDAYHERARTGPCFVCGIVARDSDALMLETAGALDIPEDEKADLAARIGLRMRG